jgi:hypothetical protein
VEKQGMKSAKRGAEMVRAGIQHAEAGICHTAQQHRKMKSAQPAASDAKSGSNPSAAKVRTGIVSVNGQDVGEMRCTGGR